MTGTLRRSEQIQAAVTGWHRVAPGAYRKGVWEIRRAEGADPLNRHATRPWVLLRATVKDGYQPRSWWHTLRLAKLATIGGSTDETNPDPTEAPYP